MAQRISPSSNGFALIISNDYRTTPGLTELTGTKVDAQAMDKAFKELRCDTLCEQNVDRGRFMQLVCETARCTNYPRNCKCIALVFSGHGHENNCLIMQDGRKVTIHEIVEHFLPRRAPAIGNIPKLFFMDACRGSGRMQAVMVPKGASAELEVLQKGGNSMATLQVPTEGNFLLAYSTMPSYEAYEMHGKGGIWMTTLADRLRSSRKSVEDVLSLVNEDLIRIYNRPDCPEWSDRMQQPEKISRLNKVVYLHPEAVSDDAPGIPTEANASQQWLRRSNSQEAGLYRGLLNHKSQAKEISKPDYQKTFEHKDGKISLGFTGVVSFTTAETPTHVEFQSPQMESSKPVAQERAAEQAWKWLHLCAPVAARTTAGETQIPVFPRQLQSPPKREASSLPRANVTAISQGACTPTSHPPTVAASPGKKSMSKLKEFCDKQGSGDPVYVELDISGERFQFKVTVKSLRPVTAVGEVCSSKKDAKHSAAQKALQKLGL